MSYITAHTAEQAATEWVAAEYPTLDQASKDAFVDAYTEFIDDIPEPRDPDGPVPTPAEFASTSDDAAARLTAGTL